MSPIMGEEIAMKETKKTNHNFKESNVPPTKKMPYYYDPASYYFFAYGEWLYWKPTTGEPMDWNRRTTSYTESTTSVKSYNYTAGIYDFSSGFRIGAGVRLKENAWKDNIRSCQFENIFTHIFSRSSNNEQVPNPTIQFLEPSFAANAEFAVIPSYIDMTPILLGQCGRAIASYSVCLEAVLLQHLRTFGTLITPISMVEIQTESINLALSGSGMAEG